MSEEAQQEKRNDGRFQLAFFFLGAVMLAVGIGAGRTMGIPTRVVTIPPPAILSMTYDEAKAALGMPEMEGECQQIIPNLPGTCALFRANNGGFFLLLIPAPTTGAS